MKRISCTDLALGYACNRVFEAGTGDEVLEQALAHSRGTSTTSGTPTASAGAIS